MCRASLGGVHTHRQCDSPLDLGSPEGSCPAQRTPPPQYAQTGAPGGHFLQKLTDTKGSGPDQAPRGWTDKLKVWPQDDRFPTILGSCPRQRVHRRRCPPPRGPSLDAPPPSTLPWRNLSDRGGGPGPRGWTVWLLGSERPPACRVF